jgi:hypothetical protein
LGTHADVPAIRRDRAPEGVELAALGEHLLRERKEIVQERVQIGMSHGTARAET